METKCLPASEASIKLAAELINNGECVALPTETVYGLAANALNTDAVMRIFEAKNRPADNPLIVHIGKKESIKALTTGLPDMALRAIDAFWPGPLTLILERSAIVPDAVTAGHSTVAVRFPANPVMLAVIDAAGCPLAAPSANRSGAPSPTRAAHVMEDMKGRIPLIVDGGPCEIGIESTVLDVADPSRPPALLRPGFITLEALRDVLGHVDDASNAGSENASDTGGEAPRSPGMKYRHYAPRASLALVRGSSGGQITGHIIKLCDEALAKGEKPAVLCFDETKGRYAGFKTFVLGSVYHLETVSHRIFDILRELDAQGVTTVFCETVDPTGLGLALMNRLTRAAGFNVIDII